MLLRKLNWNILWVLMTALALTACHEQQTITGNGTKQTVARNVSTFQNIKLTGNYDVVLIGQMPQQVSLTADSNVLQYVTTNIKDDTLCIATAPNVKLNTKQAPMLEIFVPSIQGITIEGSGNINATKIAADKLAITISGSGNFNVSGQANKADITISGAGEVNGQDLITQKANIDVSGSGQVSINSAQELDVKVSGSGLVEYYGSPSKVTQNITGSGRVIGISSDAKKSSN